MAKEKLKEVLLTSEYVIVAVGAAWCGFCKKFAPVFEEVAVEHGKQYKFAKVDVTEETEFPQMFKISAFPTILFMKDGEEVGRELGFMSKEDFTAKIAKHFGGVNLKDII
jgi:thioredoxin 1